MERRLARLRRTFLPKTFDPTGSYPTGQIDQTIAYQVMAHAAIETYVEDIALATIGSTLKRWETKRAVTLPILALVSYCGSPPGDNSVPLREVIGSANKVHSKRVHANNGVREVDIRTLLLPVGIGDHDFGSWLQMLDSFGGRRGESAHGKATVKIPDPKTELDAVTEILEGLKAIDSTLTSLRANR